MAAYVLWTILLAVSTNFASVTSLRVRLVTVFGGTCLRANGGTPPWKNSVTHDGGSDKQKSIMWEVEEVEIPENDELTDYLTEIGSPLSMHSNNSSLLCKNNAEKPWSPNIEVPSKHMNNAENALYGSRSVGSPNIEVPLC